jgi:hypothetical protein
MKGKPLIINIDTSQGVTDRDLRVLRALIDGTETPTAVAAAPATKKTAAKKTAAPAKAAELRDEAVASPDDGGEDLREQALAVATEFLSSGQRAKVKKALDDIGVERVGSLSAEQAQEFIDTLRSSD